MKKGKPPPFAKLIKQLTEAYGEGEASKIIPSLNAHITVVQEIHFDSGMKAGATLHCKLTGGFETDI